MRIIWPLDPLQATLEPMGGALVGQFETKGRRGLTLPRHALFGQAIGGKVPKGTKARQPYSSIWAWWDQSVGRTLEAVKSKLPQKETPQALKIQILKP
jgi:hypothetical protein